MEHNGPPWIIWGSELSPFTLKLIRLFRQSGLPFRFLPAQGRVVENLRLNMRRFALVAGRLPLSWPQISDEDEFPLVPFVFGPNGENMYDSTAVAQWLDIHHETGFTPTQAPAAFVVKLIDDYADEWGLYMAHHFRWKVSAKDNDAGQRVANEQLGPLPGKAVFAQWFSARQVRRLPYLFSVAPQGFRCHGLPSRRQPPARQGFPATHEILESAFDRLLAALEPLLASRNFVLGERFTLADASLYGQLGMNLSDPSACTWI